MSEETKYVLFAREWPPADVRVEALPVPCHVCGAILCIRADNYPWVREKRAIVLCNPAGGRKCADAVTAGEPIQFNGVIENGLKVKGN